MTNRFNLIDEAWIPVADHGLVSLKQVFTDKFYRSLGGNPVQRVSVMKLLLAIAQSASSPSDEKAWRALGADGLSKACLSYLAKWHDRFYLFGDKPFLQMPSIDVADIKPFGAVLPEVGTGNTTVITQAQMQRELTESDLCLLLVSIMSFALGGKKTDNKVTLTKGYQGKQKPNGKPNTGKPGPSLEFMGLLHTYLLGRSLQETLWLNLFTTQQVDQLLVCDGGLGVAPWEKMPSGEDCDTARSLQKTFIGRLVPINRFVLLAEEGLHYSEGIVYSGYKEGGCDNTVAIDNSKAKPKALWVNPDKRPWRSLTALLSFLDQQNAGGFECRQLSNCIPRVRDECDEFAIWSGGIKVSSNAGEQYVTGRDDYVESSIWLQSKSLGATWFHELSAEMDELDNLSKHLYGRVMGYFKTQQADGADIAARSTQAFWQLIEGDFQSLVDGCDQMEIRHGLRRRFAAYLYQAYDQHCPNNTARQLDAWARYKPKVGGYLSTELK